MNLRTAKKVLKLGRQGATRRASASKAVERAVGRRSPRAKLIRVRASGCYYVFSGHDLSFPAALEAL